MTSINKNDLLDLQIQLVSFFLDRTGLNQPVDQHESLRSFLIRNESELLLDHSNNFSEQVTRSLYDSIYDPNTRHRIIVKANPSQYERYGSCYCHNIGHTRTDYHSIK